MKILLVLMGFLFCLPTIAQNSSPSSLSPPLTEVEKKDPWLVAITPFSHRGILLPKYTWMFGIRYGLVGTGPTRLVDDLRFAVTPWLELRTAFYPLPSSFMIRMAIGDVLQPWGNWGMEAGLANWDTGIRISAEESGLKVGMRFIWEFSALHKKVWLPTMSSTASVRYRMRQSLLPNDDTHSLAGHLGTIWNASRLFAIHTGVATTISLSPMKESAVIFSEIGQPGLAHLLSRSDSNSWEITLPLALSYSRVESFDIHIFCTPRVVPTFGILMGAGAELRF